MNTDKGNNSDGFEEAILGASRTGGKRILIRKLHHADMYILGGQRCHGIIAERLFFDLSLEKNI